MNRDARKLFVNVAIAALFSSIGAAAGFTVGHMQGRPNNVHELDEAKNRAEAALQRQKTLELTLASRMADAEREKSRFEDALNEQGQQVDATRDVATRAVAHAQALKDKLDALTRKNSIGGIRSAAPGDVAGIPTFTAKEMETFGGDMVGHRRQLVCWFQEVDDHEVKYLLRDDNYVGLRVIDEKDNWFNYAFAKKSKFGRELLNLKGGTKIRLIGVVNPCNDKFILLVEEILR